MPDVPEKDDMTAALDKTISLAGQELGSVEAVKLSEVMTAMCLSLTDIEMRYYVTFSQAGEVQFQLDDPGTEPMLTITTSADVFHRMAFGEANPAMEFAMRRVKMAGVPVTRLTKVGGPLIDTLFNCYRQAMES